MTFFYDLNKRMAELANKQTLAEGKNAKPDFLDMDKDGNKTEPMKKAVADKEKQVDEAGYSATAARAGKDIGKPGKAFGKIAADAAKRYGSKEKGEKVAGAVLAKLRAKEDVNEADVEEGNEFSGALARAKAAGASEFEVDGKKYKVTNEGFKEMDAYLEKKKKEAGTGKFDKKQISTGTVYTRKHDDEDEEDDEEASDKPKKKGRKTVGAGKGKKLGAKSHGTSKLARKGSIAEDDSIPLVDKGEYDREGEMAKQQIHTILRAAKKLHSMMGDDDNLPEWVQKKITLAQNYIDGVADYMASVKAEQGEEMPIAEKAVSQAQRKAAGIAYAAAKGDIPKSELRGASKEMAKMPAGELKKFAKTKEKGLPEKVKEEGADEPKAKKAAGGIEFGKGVYESIDSQVESMITESMNVNVSMSTGQNGEPTKSITVSAEGADAEVLAQLLNLAGMKNKTSGCGCGQKPCGCGQVDEAYGDTTPTENEPDYPTDEEVTGDDDELLRRWAGGLNKPKSTGQTTIPVIASQTNRQVSEEAEADKLGMNLYAELKSFKAK
jgi:hypothetical protein